MNGNSSNKALKGRSLVLILIVLVLSVFTGCKKEPEVVDAIGVEDHAPQVSQTPQETTTEAISTEIAPDQEKQSKRISLETLAEIQEASKSRPLTLKDFEGYEEKNLSNEVTVKRYLVEGWDRLSVEVRQQRPFKPL